MLGRRAFVLGLSAAACSREQRTADTSAMNAMSSATLEPAALPSPLAASDGGLCARGQVKVDTWTLADGGRAVALVPAWRRADEKLPLLFALHGRGEARKGPALGVMGWPKDYALVRAIERVCTPPLTKADFEGMVDPSRLREHNAALAARPFAGLVIVCPYSPDVDLRKPREVRDYARYFMNVLVPRAYRELPVLGTPAATGIDGVSLGGALALRIGLGHAEAFGTIGSLQAAIGEDQIDDFTALGRAARAKNAHAGVRLLTSDKDFFRSAIEATSAAWKKAGIMHEFAEVPGVHDYPFNRGPGAIEMLLWHDRKLARA